MIRLDEYEEVLVRQQATYINNKHERVVGDLYVTSKRVVFDPKNQDPDGMIQITLSQIRFIDEIDFSKLIHEGIEIVVDTGEKYKFSFLKRVDI
ncbi:hypothetical protein SY83_17695 [Paenibacillus swuensis]|uniref:GRAM domain-containing protein n=1 Tax=Paenibacillus swuensis TaxID=1178515 RepID=A0A172TLY0_9BACL|nr:GRAM domain-containing protein [Paenibacillus swuensis]ANE47817.1 hypothetical protein SY83_17695 [Paenibacillus swuensis]